MKIKIFCTLGPESINHKFLKSVSGKVHLLRLNMSHLSIAALKKNIIYIKKNSKIPICLDTEGAQIRSKIFKKKFFKTGSRLRIFDQKMKIKLYPEEVKNLLKLNDQLDIGFEGLKVKIIKITKDFLEAKVISEGWFEDSKGVHVTNRYINLNCLTKKDLKAIKVAKKYKIKNFALSFTNTSQDVKTFNKLLPNYTKIFKIESNEALKNLNDIISKGKNFLIDRGDLSKSTSLEMLPVAQRDIMKKVIKSKKNVFVATNLLESMIFNKSPTRGEINDVFNILELGASGLVLAAETAIGKNPAQCVDYLLKVIKTYRKYGRKIRYSN